MGLTAQLRHRTAASYTMRILVFSILSSSCLLVLAAGLGCDCDHFCGSEGGCKITRPATPGLGCRCDEQTSFACIGHETRCTDEGSPKCQNPDTSYESCLQGGGNCRGYYCPHL